ncbi:MAG TPA: F0F1 ATP synthase subunit A, partial [Actinomycetota bacterium]|nr:F0F1 ATP synthase subunit A [Actinomycetota bacterium]
MGAVVPMAEIEPGCHLGNDFGCGFPAPDASIFDIEPYFGNFTKPVFLLLLGSLLIIIFFLTAFRRPQLIPSKLQSIGEMGYLFIRDGISREVIGKDGDR